MSNPAVDWTSKDAEKRLARRYAAERRFKLFGLAAVALSLAFLVFLLGTMLIGGIGGIDWNFLTGSDATEASAAGVSFGTMLAEFASPVLLLLLFLHACVGYVELGTDSWISKITGTIADGQGLYLFIYASLVMTVLRFVAGPIVEKINPLGLLCLSAALGAAGLYLIGSVNSVALVWVAVTVYSLGKTFLWPTMLGVVGERFPKGGALTMGAIGGVGMLSAGLLGGPGIGYKQDYFASQKLQEEAKETYERYASGAENGFLVFPKVKGLDGAKVGVLSDEGKALAGDVKILQDAKTYDTDKNIKPLNEWWQKAQTTKDKDKAPVTAATLHGGQMAMKYTALVPLTMFFGYLLLVIYFASTGGYKAVRIDATGQPQETNMPLSAGRAMSDGESGPTAGQA